MACFDIDDQLTEHVFLFHCVNSLVQFISIDISNRHGKESWCSMVRVEHEDLRFVCRLEYSLASSEFRITSQDGIKIVSWSFLVGIINFNSSVHIGTIGLVEYLPWEWVLCSRSNIIIGHNNNVFYWYSVFLEYLPGVEHIWLMSVVPVTFWPCYQDSPLIEILCGNKTKCQDE